MEIDLNKYATNKEFVLNVFNRGYRDNPSMGVSVLACATSCPCIVIAHWVAEEIGWTPEVSGLIARLKEFYGYTRVLGSK